MTVPLLHTYRTAATPAVLEVEVININDNPPEFDSDNLTESLQEESAAGQLTGDTDQGLSRLREAVSLHCRDRGGRFGGYR